MTQPFIYAQVDANGHWTGQNASQWDPNKVAMTEAQWNALVAAYSANKKITINADGSFTVDQAATLTAQKAAKKRELQAAKDEHQDKQVYANIGKIVDATDLLMQAFNKQGEAVKLLKGATEPANSNAQAQSAPTHEQVGNKMTEAENKATEATTKINEAKAYKTLDANYATLLGQINNAATTEALAAVVIPDDLSAALPQSNEGA